MAKQFILKPHHTTYQKLDKLLALADELGLTLHFQSGVCILNDVDKPNIDFRVEDIEGSDVISFPHCTETKIVYREE